MNICVIGSLRDLNRLNEIAAVLRERGHNALLPLDTSGNRFGDRKQAKRAFMEGMFEQMKKCDSVLAVNDTERGGMKGYIGPNTFLQLGLAMSLKKPLFSLAKWDDRLPYAEELDALGINLLDIKLPF